jgi:hypothetical protein
MKGNVGYKDIGREVGDEGEWLKNIFFPFAGLALFCCKQPGAGEGPARRLLLRYIYDV